MELSIVIPVYNSMPYLTAALESLDIDLHESFEIIIVNDGSTDDSPDVCRRFADKHPRVKMITQVNKGYGAACNAGLDQACGEYVAFFEPDDILGVGFYRTLCDTANSSGVDMVRYNGCYTFSEAMHKKEYCLFSPVTNRVLTREDVPELWTIHPCHWNAIYRRKTLKDARVRFVETPGAAFQDDMFHVSLYYVIKTFIILDKIGYYYRDHPAQSIKGPGRKVDAIVENWRQELSWLHANGHTDMTGFIAVVFFQFEDLVSGFPGISRQECKRLHNGIKEIIRKSGVRSLDFPAASIQERVYFKFMRLHPPPLTIASWFRVFYEIKDPAIPLIQRLVKNCLPGFLRDRKLKKHLSERLTSPSPSLIPIASESPPASLWNDFVKRADVLVADNRAFLSIAALAPQARLAFPNRHHFDFLLRRAQAIILETTHLRRHQSRILYKYARRVQLPMLYANSGFLTSIGFDPAFLSGCKPAVLHSIILDTKGDYLDPSSCSMLIDLLNSEYTLKPKEVSRGSALIKLMRVTLAHAYGGLTNGADFPLRNGDESRKLIVVLVDAKARGRDGNKVTGNVDELSELAKTENPGAEVIVVRHGGAHAKTEDMKTIYRLLSRCDKVYVTDSPLGFVGLLFGKDTVITGTPFYAGWGIGDARSKSPILQKRIRRRSVEEIAYFLFVEYTRYIDLTLMRPCEVEASLSHFLALLKTN